MVAVAAQLSGGSDWASREVRAAQRRSIACYIACRGPPVGVLPSWVVHERFELIVAVLRYVIQSIFDTYLLRSMPATASTVLEISGCDLKKCEIR